MMVQEEKTQMQTSKTQKVYSKSKVKTENLAEPDIQKYLTVSKQSKTMKNETRLRLWIETNKTMDLTWLWCCGCGAQTWLDERGVSVEGKVRILQWLWLNLETKYCGEVILDEVQLWNRKQVTWVKLSDRGKNMTRNLKTLEPENMIKDLKQN